jgi:iron complex transport system substrate-binding protein
VDPKIVALSALLLVGLSGCGERAEPLEPHVSPYPVSVRGAGDRLAVLNGRPERIVALDAGAAELVGALGAADRLAGIPSDTTVAAPTDVARVVGLGGQTDVDAVVALEPDLLIAAPSTDPGEVARLQRETASPLYVEPDRSVADVVRATLELGLVVDEPVTGRRLAESIRRTASEVAMRVAAEEPVSVFIDTGFFVTAPDHSLLADLVRRAGGERVAVTAARSEAFAPCEVLRLEPEVILTMDTPASVLARFSRADCPAEGVDVVELPDELARAGPRVGDALERIARALHPDAFA